MELVSYCCCVLLAGCSDFVVGCHVSSRAAAMLQKLLRGPRGPLLGQIFGTLPLVTLPNVPMDGLETCWKRERERGRASETSQDPIRLGMMVNVLHQFCWQQDVPGCESCSSRGLRLSHRIQTHVRVHVHMHAPSQFPMFFCS